MKSTARIALDLNVSKAAILRRLKKYDIPVNYSLGITISSPHQIVIGILGRLSIEHTTAYRLPYRLPGQIKGAKPYEIDEYLPDHKVFIEINGDYWHNLPYCKQKDALKNKLLSKHLPDHTLLVIWEKDIKTGNAEEIIAKHLANYPNVVG